MDVRKSDNKTRERRVIKARRQERKRKRVRCITDRWTGKE